MNKNSSFFSSVASKKLNALKGNQRKIVIALYKNYSDLELATSQLTFDKIVETTGINKNSLQTTIRRLIQKGFIARQSFKTGRGGWSTYELNRELYADIKGRTKLFTATQKGRTNEKNVNEKGRTNHEKRAHKKSSSYININNIYNNTTTVREENWKKVDYSALQKIGFTKFQVEQVQRKGQLTAEQLQNSINRFAYSLENNKKYKNTPNPLNLIMGVLVKGGQWNESNYKTPLEIAKELAETHERQKAVESMRVEEERKAELTARAEAEITKAYENWQATLTEQDTVRIASEYAQKVPGANYLSVNVRKRLYFRNFVLADSQSRNNCHD